MYMHCKNVLQLFKNSGSRARIRFLHERILTKMAAKLRLVQFEAGGSTRVGVELADGGSVVDITAVDPAIPIDMKTFLEGGEENLAAAYRYINELHPLLPSHFNGIRCTLSISYVYTAK